MQDFQDETLRYGFVETDLGTIAVAESSEGIAALILGDDRTRMRRDLSALLPGAMLLEGASPATLAAAGDLVAHPERPFGRPLDLRGSVRELAVWEALRRIPAGETTTYGAIARTLAVAATAQEVGQACGANRIAIAVPCHRVVKADGGISGYRWGVQRKRRLINREAVA